MSRGCRCRLRRRVRHPEPGADQLRNGYRSREFDNPGRQRSSWRCPSCAPAPTSPSGCWSAASGPRRRWCRWWPPVTCSGSRPGGWRSWSSNWVSLGCRSPQVSVMAKDLDEHVESFRTRPLDAGPYTFVAADALTMKVREGGRVVNNHVLIATGVNADGHREILGLEIASAESEGRLAEADPRAGRSRPVRSQTGDLRRPHRAGRRDPRHPGRRRLATVPHPLRIQPDGRVSQGQLGVGQGDAALDLRPARRRGGARPVRPRR